MYGNWGNWRYLSSLWIFILLEIALIEQSLANYAAMILLKLKVLGTSSTLTF